MGSLTGGPRGPPNYEGGRHGNKQGNVGNGHAAPIRP